jgi:hypothetical protein
MREQQLVQWRWWPNYWLDEHRFRIRLGHPARLSERQRFRLFGRWG